MTSQVWRVLRCREGRWGGMYDYSADYGSEELARRASLWVDRERHGLAVLILRISDWQSANSPRYVVDAWSKDGTIPDTHCLGG